MSSDVCRSPRGLRRRALTGKRTRRGRRCHGWLLWGRRWKRAQRSEMRGRGICTVHHGTSRLGATHLLYLRTREKRKMSSIPPPNTIMSSMCYFVTSIITKNLYCYTSVYVYIYIYILYIYIYIYVQYVYTNTYLKNWEILIRSKSGQCFIYIYIFITIYI